MGMTTPNLRIWVKDFSPGLLSTPESDRIPIGATPDAFNADFDKVDLVAGQATLKKRAGSQCINPTTMSAGKKVDGLFEFRRTTTATRLLLAVCNGALEQFDNVDTFNAVTGGGGFTAGDSARACFFRNNAFIHDGTQMKRYDGTTVFNVGFAAPTSATAMTTAAPAGAGVTGTYESFYVWYDQLMDHESSASPITTPVVFAAQARVHTKPGGAPPVNVTHWRIYIRRDDTNELNFYQTALVPVGTATFTEEVSDVARRALGVGPFDSDNNPPPGAFSVLSQWKGFGIGILPNDDSFYVSKQGDLESWHPKNRFPVNRGDGEALNSALPFGTDILLQKGHATYRLDGDAIPFTITPLHSRWGNVSQESGLEVDGKFYAWDRERGPYWTDTVNWTSMVDGRITTVLAMVNRAAIGDIRAVYDELNHVIRWAVPVIGSTRKRLVLKWHVGLQCWLPPDTGLEYGSLCTFTSSDGLLGVYVGDYWGRVYHLGLSDREGVPSGTSTVTGKVTSATANTVTVAGAAFDIVGSGLAGLPVAVVSTSGTWQWRRILSNTATVLTLDTTNDTAWTTIPDATYTLIVGGIRWYHTTPVYDFGFPEVEKSLNNLFVQGRATSATAALTVAARFNDDIEFQANPLTFPLSGASDVWGTMIWGTGHWSSASRSIRKASIGRSAAAVQFQMANFFPDQPVALTAFIITADPLAGRKSPGVGE